MKLKDLFETPKIIEGDVYLPNNTTKLNYEGATVKGNFVCANTKIKSLKGAPNYVGGHFTCANTKITSLIGAPIHVGGFLVALIPK